ncbi:MAG: thiamine phosphate synthase [Deltaproteobacteria bacterium]|nr:thiamine phosphate synthase [Deltaproteobacteria bacterium]
MRHAGQAADKRPFDSEDPASRLYLITDRKLRPDEDLMPAVKEALDAGARLIQLREKDLPARRLLELARELRALTARYKARLFVNDRIDIALISKADGVHLGQASFGPKDARSIKKEGFLIGVSAHGIEEAKKAEDEGADFITLGPIYPTPSKLDYGEPLGLDMIKKTREAVHIPIFAIGGIERERIKDVINAGAYGAALIRAIFTSTDIGKDFGEILAEAGLRQQPR